MHLPEVFTLEQDDHRLGHERFELLPICDRNSRSCWNGRKGSNSNPIAAHCVLWGNDWRTQHYRISKPNDYTQISFILFLLGGFLAASV